MVPSPPMDLNGTRSGRYPPACRTKMLSQCWSTSRAGRWWFESRRRRTATTAAATKKAVATTAMVTAAPCYVRSATRRESCWPIQIPPPNDGTSRQCEERSTEDRTGRSIHSLANSLFCSLALSLAHPQFAGLLFPRGRLGAPAAGISGAAAVVAASRLVVVVSRPRVSAVLGEDESYVPRIGEEEDSGPHGEGGFVSSSRSSSAVITLTATTALGALRGLETLSQLIEFTLHPPGGGREGVP